ncbi:rab-GTPase-TBC domain-containing protein [Aspergillus cavernicola]|uniref:Rab-GTPase-TBC domain-containing protein n=1 Tax=Aspergillus cavernicola TaxID=176166 RepID=A0ABR4IGE7_9EURO
MAHLSRSSRSESASSKTHTSLENDPVTVAGNSAHVSSGDRLHVAKTADAIRRACDLRDLDALVSYATSEGGFLQDELRRLAWPILLQCDQSARESTLLPEHDLPPHGDEEQVQLDVNRSFVYYPECSDEELSSKKNELYKVIKQVLRNYPMLCYFQGYHDIVQVVLLVLGENQSAPVVARVSLLRIRDYMLPSLSPAVKHLQLIPEIIETADKALSRHISGIQPFFALSATLTLYAHDIQEYSDIARLFDFFLAWEPVVSIYLFAAIVMSRRKELLEIPADEPEMIHFTLSKLPSPLDLEGLISRAVQLFHDCPPESLQSKVWKRIPQCSVLKTSRDVFKRQSTDTVVELFHQQTRQLRSEERKKQVIGFLWSHRRTISSVAVAVLIGAMSIWIRKRGLDNSILSYIDRFRMAFQSCV